MTTNKNIILQALLKISQKAILLILCISLIASASICYASSEFKITDVGSISRKDISTGIKIIDLRDNAFDLTFKIPREKGTPYSSSFEIIDGQDKIHAGKISIPDEVCNAYVQNGTEYNYPCNMQATLPKNNSATDAVSGDFTATVYLKKGPTEITETIEGRTPELAATLKSSKQNQTQDTLEIKNTCSEKIIITKINGTSHIDIPRTPKIILLPNENYDLKLNLKDSIAMGNKSDITELITVKYRTEDESLLSEIELNIKKIDDNCSAIDNNELEITAHKLEMFSEAFGECSLTIKNNTEKNIIINKTRLKSRCISSEENNDIIELASNDTAEIKFQITADPTKNSNCNEHIAIHYTKDDNKAKAIILSVDFSHQNDSYPWYHWQNYGWKMQIAAVVVIGAGSCIARDLVWIAINH